MSYCLDSSAVLRWLQGAEPAASRVAEALEQRPAMSWINLGEVAYVLQRATDRATALAAIRDLRPRLSLEVPTPERVLAAADIKAGYTMAYADAFAVATALANDAVLLTGDREIIEAGGAWMAEDIR